jgi:hypothetical protein
MPFACLGLALFFGKMNWEIPYSLGKKYFLDRVILHFKAIWPWADDDPLLPLTGMGKVAIVQPGDSISSIAKEFYGANNLKL